VRSVKVDDIIKEKVHFIKLDIEGAEYPALLGMRNILEKHKPDLLLEFHPPSIEECGNSPEHLYNFLVKMGYRRFELMDGTVVKSFRTLRGVCSHYAAENVYISVWP
jgi:hypothetical protein